MVEKGIRFTPPHALTRIYTQRHVTVVYPARCRTLPRPDSTPGTLAPRNNSLARRTVSSGSVSDDLVHAVVEVHQQPVVLAIGRPMGDDGGGEPVRAPILVLPHGFDALPDQLHLHAIRRRDESLPGLDPVYRKQD